MKKVIMIASVVALTAVSCAKDRTCTCTYSNNLTGSTTTTQTTTLVGTSKGQAKANCISTSVTTGTVVSTSDCKLS